jgi:hypothetical protein
MSSPYADDAALLQVVERMGVHGKASTGIAVVMYEPSAVVTYSDFKLGPVIE